MTRRSRIVLFAAALVGSLTFAAVVAAFEAASEAPIENALDRIGTAVGSVEYHLRYRIHGEGRRDQMREMRGQRQGAVVRLRVHEAHRCAERLPERHALAPVVCLQVDVVKPECGHGLRPFVFGRASERSMARY